MLDDIWEIFAATGYKRIIASSKETCANKEQRISNNANHNQPQCAELCEQTEDCRFYFINIQNRCNLYSSCSKRRVASYRGSTFEKMAGNYLKYVVNDIWSRNHYIFPCVCMFLFIFRLKVQDCFNDDSSYSPIDFAGQGGTDAADPEACQSRCANVDGCSYFTFWPNDNACHLSSSTATRIPDQYRAVSGPKICEEDCKLYII